MIDIIVFLNEAVINLEDTLMSIDIQKNRELLNVYLVGEIEEKLLNRFNNLKIKVIRENNRYEFNKSSSDYILFLNSGDLLFSVYSIYNYLYDVDMYDCVIGKSESFSDDIMGKLYRRSFFIKNNIEFSNRVDLFKSIEKLFLRKKILKQVTYIKGNF